MLPSSWAADYYVAPTGDDASPDGTIARPFKTLGRGAAMLKDPGDALFLRGGTYQNQKMVVAVSGTATAPIQILAYAGETPVIDGRNLSQSGGRSSPLVTLSGDYLVVNGLEARYSSGRGIMVNGSYDRVSHVFSHHNSGEGIMVTGKGVSNVVEYCDVWWNVCHNEYARAAKAGQDWGTALCSARSPRATILRHNTVHDNWGEGLDTYEAYDTIIEDNVIFNNWSVNLYTSDTPNSIVRRNLIYNTPHSPVADSMPPESVRVKGKSVGNRVACGIGFCDEVAGSGRFAKSTNVLIVNNLVMGCNGNFNYWNQDRAAPESTGLQGCLIAYNTFVNTEDQGPNRTQRANLSIGKGSHLNARIENNLFVQEDAVRLAKVVNDAELHFSHNLWSANVPAGMAGPGDILGNPGLAKTGATGPGQLAASWFKVAAGSPAIGGAKAISEVSEDFFGNPRGINPTLGAYEFK
jgi:hypothetical protein